MSKTLLGFLGLLCFSGVFAWADTLPDGGAPEPILAEHFPNRVCAVVWRNWNLTDVERLAKVLRTTPENVSRLAAQMGLPEYRKPE